MSWYLSDILDPDHNVYRRPLGFTELGFYWDFVSNGIADTLTHAVVQVTPQADFALFSRENVWRVWMEMKMRYPLLSARIEEKGRGDAVEFIVSEKRIQERHAREVTFVSVSSSEEADAFAERIINGPPQLSNDLLSRLYVLDRKDGKDLFHVLFHAAHLITDAMGNTSFNRNFLDLLCTSDPASTSALNLEQRLAMVPSSESLYPICKASIVKQRWRQACGKIIQQLRQNKSQGGHALPKHEHHPALSARSTLLSTTLSSETSAALISSCRAHQLTFGHAYPVLAQLAMARVLHRLYACGSISHEDWQYRIHQPTYTGGPLNLRPYLDSEWLEKGGAGEILISIGFLEYVLPFMPSRTTSDENEDDGAPSYEALLSAKRFWWRCQAIKRQQVYQLRHPLFMEIGLATLRGRAEAQESTIARQRRRDAGHVDLEVKQDHSMDEPPRHTGRVGAHGGSSVGNLDKLIPPQYPLPSSHPLSSRHFGKSQHQAKEALIVAQPPHLTEPAMSSVDVSSLFVSSSSSAKDTEKAKETEPVLLEILSYFVLLRCRPGELYVGASTFRKQMRMFIYCDGNVSDEGMMREWLEEIKGAAVWYLGSNGVGKVMA